MARGAILLLLSLPVVAAMLQTVAGEVSSSSLQRATLDFAVLPHPSQDERVRFDESYYGGAAPPFMPKAYPLK
jgi:hypothetical protein